MARQTVARTALGAATCRLIEQYEPQPTRLFDDPVVKGLVGTTLRVLMQSPGMRGFTMQQTDGVMRGLYGAQICRTRYIDDAVQAALAEGIRQLVILGAGYDTRPYRLPGLEEVKAFEVDLPSVQKDKKKKLQKALGRLPENVAFVPIDFDTQSLDSVLLEAGFDRVHPAIFAWEGVTQYISEEAVRRTLAFAGACVPGSRIAFTYVLKSIIERRSNIPGASHMMDVVSQSSPWIFGLDPLDVADYLKPFHLSLIEDVGNADYQERYLKPMGRKLVVSEAERIALAQVSTGLTLP